MSNMNREFPTLGITLVVLGIAFGTDRLIGYSFIGAGVLLSVVSVVWSKKAVRKGKSDSVGE